MPKQKSITNWTLLVSSLIALLEIGVSLLLIFDPKSVVETIDIQAKGVDYVIYMWATRQLALGIIFAYATLKRSAPMLTLCYVFFLVIFIGDICIGISQQQNSLVYSAIIMCAIAVGMLYAIHRNNKKVR